MTAPTIHIGDEAAPVLQVIVVHAVQAPSEGTAAWLTPEQVAQRLGVSRSKVSRLVGLGELAHRRIGSRVQVHVDSVAAFESRVAAETVASKASSAKLRSDVARAARQGMRLVGSGGTP